MTDIKKPLLFVKPFTPALKALKENILANAEAEGHDVYEIEDIEELHQTFASVGPSLTLISQLEKCSNFLKKNKKLIHDLKSKVVLVSQASVSPLELEKLQKMGLTEAMHEPIHQKTLLHKVKMLVKALPQSKGIDEEEEENVKTFSKNKDETNLNSREKMRVEKGVRLEESEEMSLDGDDDQDELFTLEKEKKKKRMGNLDIEKEEEESTNSDLTLEQPKKKSKIGNLLKSLGSLGKKKNKNELEISLDKEKKGPDSLGFDLEPDSTAKKKLKNFDIDEELKKKKLAQLSLEQEEKKKDPLEIGIEDIELMRKKGIRLDILPNTPKEHLNLILKQDPVLRKKILNFKISELAKKRKISVQELKLELEGEKKEDKGFSKAQLLEEKRKLLNKKLIEESEETQEEEEVEEKLPEPERIYEPQPKSMDKLIEILTLYQDKKVEHQEILKRIALKIYEMKGGLIAFLTYNEEKKVLDDFFVGHAQEYNQDRSVHGEDYWKMIRGERIAKWQNTKLSTWSDEWFTGKAKDVEFIYPVIEGKTLLGVIVVHLFIKTDDHFMEQDARRVEVFVESSRGFYLARFKGAKDKGEEKEDDLAGDGTSYSKIFKDFFSKIFDKKVG